MGIVSDLFGEKKSVTLTTKTISDGVPISIKETPEVIRVDSSELEQTYISDPICFNSINKAVQMIMAAGYQIIGEEQSKNKIIEFFSKIGTVGEDITFEEILEAIFKYQMIYGNAYIELVFDKSTGKRIVDLVLVDPKRMDYAKDGAGKIILDIYGKPVGYTLKIPFGETAIGDEIPTGYSISLPINGIFMLPKRICHFKLYTYGDRFYGLGMIEPCYKSVIYKQNIEQAQANSIYQRGTYPVIAYVGDAMHEATPQDIDAVLQNLVKLKHDRYSAFQHWVKLEPLEVKQSDVVQSTLEYLRLNESASLGMPLAFSTGAGEATNRATLNNQQTVLEFTLNDIVNRTLSTIRKYIITKICLYNNIKEIPEIKWGTIRADEPNDQAQRLIQYVKNQILKPEEVTPFAKKSEGI